jgi:hypothetical protein
VAVVVVAIVKPHRLETVYRVALAVARGFARLLEQVRPVRVRQGKVFRVVILFCRVHLLLLVVVVVVVQ